MTDASNGAGGGETPTAARDTAPSDNDGTNDGDAAGGAVENKPQRQPQIKISAQYTKDLSFENPNAPQSLIGQSEAPNINVAVDVQARPLGSNNFEVELRLSVNADREGKTAFVVELVYAGIFNLIDMDDDMQRIICIVECPRLLFPFARRIVSDATRDGGYPPLMLEPIDFAALFRQQMAKREQQKEETSDS